MQEMYGGYHPEKLTSKQFRKKIREQEMVKKRDQDDKIIRQTVLRAGRMKKLELLSSQEGLADMNVNLVLADLLNALLECRCGQVRCAVLELCNRLRGGIDDVVNSRALHLLPRPARHAGGRRGQRIQCHKAPVQLIDHGVKNAFGNGGVAAIAVVELPLTFQVFQDVGFELGAGGHFDDLEQSGQCKVVVQRVCAAHQLAQAVEQLLQAQVSANAFVKRVFVEDQRAT